MNGVALLEESPVRRVFHEEEWWFVISDVVGALTGSPSPSDYLKKMRRRDTSLSAAFKGEGQFIPPFRCPSKREEELKSCNAGTFPGSFGSFKPYPLLRRSRSNAGLQR
jgi:hypothetical protein